MSSPKWKLAMLCVLITGLLRTDATEETSILTPGTHRKIPYDFLATRLGIPRVPSKEIIRSLLYEVSADGSLYGPSLQINLQTQTSEAHLSKDQKHLPKYRLNGKPHPVSRSFAAAVREGNGFTVVQEAENGDVINVWGPGLFLEPLHEALYPGVFVNMIDTLSSSFKIPVPHTRPSPTRVSYTTPSVLPTSTPTPTPSTTSSATATSTPTPTTTSTATASPTSTSTATATPSPAVTPTSTSSASISPSPSPSLNTSNCRTIELAVAYDNTFCETFGNSPIRASAFVQATVNYANTIFRRDLCHSLSLSSIDSHCQDANDPYKNLVNAGSASNILTGFKQVWNNQPADILGGGNADVVYLFSGFEDGTSISGVAFLGSACSGSKFGWVERGYGPTLVHELGHSLGSGHTAAGVMKESSYRGDDVFFDDLSSVAINNFMTTPQSNCLQTAEPICDVDCAGKCVNGHCIALYDDQVVSGVIPCVPLQDLYVCVDSLDYYGYDVKHGVECASGFDFMQPLEATAAKRYDVFCCHSPTGMETREVISYMERFSMLQLSFPDGLQVVPLYIHNPSSIRTAMLMQTNLVPDCGISMTPSPSASPV